MSTATPHSMAADERRLLVDLICRKVVRKDYESGALPRDPNVDTMRDMYKDRAVWDIIGEDAWEETVQRVLTWQDQEDKRSDPAINRVMARFTRFPTVDRVEGVFDAKRAEEYRTALEAIENDPDARRTFPDERFAYPWRRFDMDAAVSAVVFVIAPNLGDDGSMDEALSHLVGELRARRRERSSMDTAELCKRKVVARSLGIWFPMTKDMSAWNSDPRTAPYMAEFTSIMNKVTMRMRLVRSYLQYVPRRRLSARACADLSQNIMRMKTYLQGFSRARPKQ